MILSYLNDINELNNLKGALILRLKGASFSDSECFSVEEILRIKEETGRTVFLSVECLYHEDEMGYVISSIRKLKNLDGFIYQDMGLMNVFKDEGILNKVVYAPETFVTSSLDIDFLKQFGIRNALISREITLENIKAIIGSSDDFNYYMKPFSHQMMFYSFRPHLTNFKNKYEMSDELKNRELYIREKTRDEFYIAIEDDRGFRISKDIIFDGYEELKNLNLNFILDRSFIKDEVYYDLNKVYNGELSHKEFINRYKELNFDKGYLFKETGLLKEKGNE